MSKEISWINLVGKYGLAGFLPYVGYLFYEKNEMVSVLLVIFGIGLSVSLIVSDIMHKHKELEHETRGFIRR